MLPGLGGGLHPAAESPGENFCLDQVGLATTTAGNLIFITQSREAAKLGVAPWSAAGDLRPLRGVVS